MKCMLSTFDNEFDPYEDFSKWIVRDKELNHHSSELLARIYDLITDKPESELMEEEDDIYREAAIDFIITHDPFGIYKKVTKVS